jgi:hypothetical protein
MLHAKPTTKYMLQKPILSGRVGKCAYALVEYDFRCEPIGSMKGQIVADFIVQLHRQLTGERTPRTHRILHCSPQIVHLSSSRVV